MGNDSYGVGVRRGAALGLGLMALLAAQGVASAHAVPGTGGRGTDPGPVAALKHGAGAAAAKAAAVPGSVGASHLVTLVTGDRLQTLVRADGTLSATLAPGARRAGVAFAEKIVPGPDGTRDLMVVPSDAAAGIASGALDERLFDVSELIRDGYDDASRASLPLIVAYQGPGSLPEHAAPLVHGGALAGRALPSIGAARFRSRAPRHGPCGPLLPARARRRVRALPVQAPGAGWPRTSRTCGSTARCGQPTT